jgi:hypothetical protein
LHSEFKGQQTVKGLIRIVVNSARIIVTQVNVTQNSRFSASIGKKSFSHSRSRVTQEYKGTLIKSFTSSLPNSLFGIANTRVDALGIPVMQCAPLFPFRIDPGKLSLKIWRILCGILGFVVGVGIIANSVAGQAIGPMTPGLQASSIESSALIPASGGLRVQNRSPYPVRVVLLSRAVKKPLDTQPQNAAPAHWDFAPWEGRLQGVLVVLAERTVRLKPGDIVVAFAQDGSRRYWGPFVVGETPEPQWDQEQEEWRMLLGE